MTTFCIVVFIGSTLKTPLSVAYRKHLFILCLSKLFAQAFTHHTVYNHCSVADPDPEQEP